jgi:hypothetical protein
MAGVNDGNDGADEASDNGSGSETPAPAPATAPAGNATPESSPTSDMKAGGSLPPTVPPAGASAADDGGGASDGEDVDVRVTDQIRNEIKDALELADFIVRTGAKRDDGSKLSPQILRTIKVTAGKVRLFEALGEPIYVSGSTQPVYIKKDDDKPIYIKASEWTRFELAYYALVEFSDPVTIDTLRDTRATGRGQFRDASSAQKFTWLLWALTGTFGALVIAAGVISTGADNATPHSWAKALRGWNNFVPIFVPWVYGGLGACAYLLRTAHDLIAKRSFDVRRKPEYLNRILLGMVSGGAIVLLFNPASDDDTVKISAAALGFVAGYSNDLLFNAVERVVNALLPKVGLETLKRDQVAPRPPLDLSTGGLTLEDLINKMEQAQQPDVKAFYQSLITKLGARL